MLRTAIITDKNTNRLWEKRQMEGFWSIVLSARRRLPVYGVAVFVGDRASLHSSEY